MTTKPQPATTKPKTPIVAAPVQDKAATVPEKAATAPAKSEKQAPAKKPASAKPTKPTKPAKPAKPVKAAKAPKVAKPAKQAKSAKPVAAKSESASKAKKVKLVRDSFTIPKDEYEQIANLKLALAKQGRTAKKSELLRAGLLLLSRQTAGALLASVDALTPVKTGRPKKD
jgi:outer membrane biosynthesis protein TonB